MTIVFGDHERRRRKKHSAPKAASQYEIVQPIQPSQSTVSVQQQTYSPPPPAVPMQQPYGYAMGPTPPHSGSSLSPPPPFPGYFPPSQQHHPIYGPTPQYPQHYSQPYASPPLQPAQPYIGNSTVSIATVSPQPEKEGYLRSHWNRAERLASRSCQDLSAQLSSSANKSVTMLSSGANKSVNVANKSVNKITTNCIERPTHLVTKKSVQALNQGAALCDRISTKLDAVITSIDGGLFSGKEQDLLVEEDDQPYASASTLQPTPTLDRSANAIYSSSSNAKSSNFFSKVWLYSNSRLPPHLPPFKAYMPTYPLLCLAASYSERVYTPPSGLPITETETHIPADWRSGTKAMVLKALPIDDMNTVVFAIRGSATFMDWAVNYRSDPASPDGFLDDPGNLCHAGFLQVARKMIKPVAERLRVLLQENPARSNASLLITGHSAGGAVAALLFAHMMSAQQSELSYLTGFFKRVHCVTFGAPPVTLLPLKKPDEKRHRKSLFYSFINEGDPVPRADKAVVRSLLKLYSSPAPERSCTSAALVSISKLNLCSNGSQSTFQTTTTTTTTSSPPTHPTKQNKSRKFAKPSKTSLKTTSTGMTTSSAPSWAIPPCALSPAGRLVVLRQRIGGSGEEDIEAVTVGDEMLRSVVYGDPLKHQMKVYKRRVECIATKAVTASDY